MWSRVVKLVSIIKYPEKISAFDKADLHPVLKKVYLHRDVSTEDELDYQLKQLLPFSRLKDIDSAAETIAEAVRQNLGILIVGDFDADGATSTAVATRLLKAFGSDNVDFLVPNRFDFGYGLTKELLEQGMVKKPDLIITVDNGISSIEGVAYANELGIKVIITDHHLSADELPDAVAIVNPNQPGCQFKSKSIAGVGVIFYVMMAVRTKLRESCWFNQDRQEPNLASVLDLVALGTVADVVPLDRNNRILVDQGLKRIRSDFCCPGIKALLSVAGRELSNCVASDLAFAIAPRLNAAGRLEDMAVGINCLISDNLAECETIAENLHQLNIDRRQIEADMVKQAMSELDQIVAEVSTENLPSAIVLYNSSWHQGVIGILASRVKEKFNRPVIAFASSENNQIKGSARSIKGFHIRDALDVIDKQHQDLILKFGGHAMAAGLSLKEDDFHQFKSAFEEYANDLLTEEDLHGVIYSDGELSGNDINLQLAEILRYAGPWGQHFPEPVFDNIFMVEEWRIVGGHHLKLSLRLPGSGQAVDAIAFNKTEEHLGANTDKVHAVYKLDVNEFRNRKSVQLLIEYLEPA